jgi:predicted TIM-barrel fold metal-dependent hydrolase
MSYQGHPVIDSDSHIREYIDIDRTFKDNMDPEYRDAYDDLSRAVKAHQSPGREQVLFMNASAVIGPTAPRRPMGVHDRFGPPERQNKVAEETVPDTGHTWQGNGIDMACNWEPSLRLRDMDTAQVDVSVMFPSQADGFCVLRDTGFEQALYRAYHRFVSNFCADGDGRLRWVATSNLRDIRAGVDELIHWTERDENVAGWFIPRACPDGRLLDNPDLHRIFAAAQDLEVPIMVHGGTMRPPLTPGATELDNAGFIINAVYHGWGGMTAVSALIGGGIFDLFPRLRVGIFESGAGWLPWLVERMDVAYRPSSGMTPNLSRKPSEVIAEGRLFCSIEPDEEHLDYAVEALGEDIWLFSTDYPHQGSPWPDGVPMVVDRKGLSGSAKIKMLGANALRMFPRIAKKVRAVSVGGS